MLHTTDYDIKQNVLKIDGISFIINYNVLIKEVLQKKADLIHTSKM